MMEALTSSASVLTEGLNYLFTQGLQNFIMLCIAGGMFYLAIKKGVEPLLLVPIAFGCFLVNLPLSEVMHEDGFLRVFYDAGIRNEMFPLLIFIGIGSMTDFSPLLANPKILLFGAAGQLGIFLTLGLALALGFDKLDAVSIAVIGACDGPTVIYVASEYAPHMLGAVSVAAYSYMALVPIIQPPIMRFLTTEKERKIVMPTVKNKVSQPVLLLFPLVVTAVTALVAPKGLPLMGAIMLGNFMKVSAAVPRLAKASENEIASAVTLMIGLAIGGTMEGHAFLKVETLMIFGLGFVAICVDTAGGIFLGKVMNWLSGGKVNPLIGAAGISAYPMAARIVEIEGLKYNKQNHMLMHAMGANTGGQIGSVMAASIMLAILKGMGII